GQSGSGKTTLLKIIAGILDVDQGTMYLDNQDITDLPIRKRNIAYVFQEQTLFPHLTIYENILNALKLSKISFREKDIKVKEIAKILDLAKYLNLKPEFLSGGQIQRVALAKAFIRNPKLILLDEPLSHIDESSKRNYRVMIKKLQ